MVELLLLVGTLSLGQFVHPGESPAVPPMQPIWLETHMRFEYAGDLIVAGDYRQAREVLTEVAAKFPPPYSKLPEGALRGLPKPVKEGERHDEEDDPFGSEPAAEDVDDLFGDIGLDDPSGTCAANSAHKDKRGTNDLLRLATLCREIEAHAAALTLYQRAWEKSGKRAVVSQIVHQLWMTRARPEDAAGWVEKINESDRDYWNRQMEQWPTPWLGAGDFMGKLSQWRKLTPLTRLTALESLRPQADTNDRRIALFEGQLEAFHELGDYRERNNCLEAAIQLAGDRADVCGGLLEKVANKTLHSGSKTDEPVTYFRRIVDEYPSAPQFGRAITVLANAAVKRNDDAEAIRHFERLFAWASEHPGCTDFRQPHRVSLHTPARSLSLAYERRGDLTRALEYARLAQTNYRYQSFCGTGYEEHLRCVSDRVTHLEVKLKASRDEFEPVDIELISD